jgi:2-oxo-4-hydroxy-4-carboxy--5-ureidoimidazoline (OHCU) decarboxylase
MKTINSYIAHPLLKCPEMRAHSLREELLKNKWPYIKEELALRKTLTARSANEQRNLGNLAYNIKFKLENHAKTIALRMVVSKNETV